MDAKKLKTLAAAMRDAKVLHLKTPDVEVVLHPSAFVPDVAPPPRPKKGEAPPPPEPTLAGFPLSDPLLDGVR